MAHPPRDGMVRLGDSPALSKAAGGGGADRYTDKTIICRDCSAEFIWTAGEQDFYAQKELSPPKRCKGCVAIKRGEIEGRKQ